MNIVLLCKDIKPEKDIDTLRHQEMCEDVHRVLIFSTSICYSRVKLYKMKINQTSGCICDAI